MKRWMTAFCLLAAVASPGIALAEEPIAAYAWGEPIDGLVAGVRLAREPEAYRGGYTVRFEVVVRNASDKQITLSYLSPAFPIVSDDCDELKLSSIYIGDGIESTVTLEPGASLPNPTEYAFRTWTTLPTESSGIPKLDLKGGRFKVHCPAALVTGDKGEKFRRLATGMIEVDIPGSASK